MNEQYRPDRQPERQPEYRSNPSWRDVYATDSVEFSNEPKWERPGRLLVNGNSGPLFAQQLGTRQSDAPRGARGEGNVRSAGGNISGYIGEQVASGAGGNSGVRVAGGAGGTGGARSADSPRGNSSVGDAGNARATGSARRNVGVGGASASAVSRGSGGAASRGFGRTPIYDDDWTNDSVREIRRPDGEAQARSAATPRSDARRHSTMASRSASTAVRTYSSERRASALRGDRILIDDDSLRMDKVTQVRGSGRGPGSGSSGKPERFRSIEERADAYKEPRRTPSQIASRSTYKNSNIYSRNNSGKQVFASRARTRQWSSPRKERQRRSWLRWAGIGVVAVAVIVLVVNFIGCIFG